jgi:hypothetical protein
MKKQLPLLQLLTLGMIFAPAMAMAAAPDFNGSWVRNAGSSDPAPNQMYWMTRGAPAGGGGGRGAGQVILNVHGDGKSLNVAESNEVVRKYTLDGAPHTRATDTGIQKAVDTAALQGDNLVIETTQPYGGMPGNATLKVKRVWSLSPDGKTLTITTTRDVAARNQAYKQVYNWTQPKPGEICSAGCVVPK